MGSLCRPVAKPPVGLLNPETVTGLVVLHSERCLSAYRALQELDG